jgi:type IV pilus assembly protein PilN
MRLNINLASQPYQDVRRFYLRWGLAVFATLLLTIGLVYAASTSIRSWRTTRKQISERRAQIAERDRQRAAVEAFLARPANRDTRDRSQFINYLIARKAFSWTEVFTDLEKIIPPRLHVVSIQPTINNNQLELHMVVAGSSREAVIELLSRLEDSPHFAHAQVNNESATPPSAGSPDTVRFDISALYVPNFSRRAK